MGLLYLKNEEKRLYSAYGLTVYGRQDRYEWTIYSNKPDENVYTSLRIERNGVEAIREEERRQLNLIKQYCEKKNLLFKQYYEKVYLIKLHNKDARQMIENADNKQFEGLRDFMNEHPDNTDAVIVMNGNIEDIARQIA